MRQTRFSRSQRATIVSGILGIVLVLVIVQLWLLTATVNAALGVNSYSTVKSREPPRRYRILNG